MSSQTSQFMVEVSFLLEDARCVSNYFVNVTRQEDGYTTSVLPVTSSPVIVKDLDLCRYSYSFVGYTTSVTGEVSEVSAPVNLTADLTGNLCKVVTN